MAHLDDRPHGEIVRLAERIEQIGAFNLTEAMYQSLTRIDPALPAIERGRLIAKLGRVRRRLGRYDEAFDAYRKVLAMGKEMGEPELEARAFVGFGAIAQVQGDFGELRRNFLRAARIAKRIRNRELIRLTYQGLSMAAAHSNDFSRAITYCWEHCEASSGEPEPSETRAQRILGSRLSTGNFAAARAAFALVLTRPQLARIALPALGGLALAAAWLRDVRTVNWAATELLREVSRSTQLPRGRRRWRKCGMALASVGRAVEGETVVSNARFASLSGTDTAQSCNRRLKSTRGSAANAPHISSLTLGCAPAASCGALKRSTHPTCRRA